MSETKGRKPSHTLWYVQDFTAEGEEEKRERWTRVGAAWLHKSGSGMNLNIDFYPAAPGKYVILEYKEKPKGDVTDSDTAS